MTDPRVPQSCLHDLTIPRPSDTACWREVAGEMVILDTQGSMIRGLNATGGQVWALLGEGRTIRAICDTIAERTGTDRAVVTRDVTAFLTRLCQLGLVAIDPPHDGG